MSNLEAVPVLTKCVDKLKLLKEKPLEMLDATLDVFGHELDPADVVSCSLQSKILPQEKTEFEDVCHQLVAGSVEVLEKQLNRYLHGELSTPSDEMLHQAMSVPIHNIFAEQVLGLMDHQYRRAPNATIGFIDGKVKAKKNGTLGWLDGKTAEEQLVLQKFAIKRARQVRSLRSTRDEKIRKICYSRRKKKTKA